MHIREAVAQESAPATLKAAFLEPISRSLATDLSVHLFARTDQHFMSWFTCALWHLLSADIEEALKGSCRAASVRVGAAGLRQQCRLVNRYHIYMCPQSCLLAHQMGCWWTCIVQLLRLVLSHENAKVTWRYCRCQHTRWSKRTCLPARA